MLRRVEAQPEVWMVECNYPMHRGRSYERSLYQRPRLVAHGVDHALERNSQGQGSGYEAGSSAYDLACIENQGVDCIGKVNAKGQAKSIDV